MKFDNLEKAFADDSFCELIDSLQLDRAYECLSRYKGRRKLTALLQEEGINVLQHITTIVIGMIDGNVQQLKIPSNVTTIGEYAFDSCSSLTSVNIPDSVTSIGEDAFYFCRSLASINIPNSVTSIGSFAFYGCGSLTSINFAGTRKQWSSVLKAYSWRVGCNLSKIVCTDGVIDLI